MVGRSQPVVSRKDSRRGTKIGVVSRRSRESVCVLRPCFPYCCCCCYASASASRSSELPCPCGDTGPSWHQQPYCIKRHPPACCDCNQMSHGYSVLRSLAGTTVRARRQARKDKALRATDAFKGKGAAAAVPTGRGPCLLFAFYSSCRRCRLINEPLQSAASTFTGTASLHIHSQ